MATYLSQFTDWLVIPLNQQQLWYTFSITLSQVLYNFEVRYNIRMARWILTISDAAQNVVVAGIPLLIDRDLLGQYYLTYAIPSNPLLVSDDSGQELQATLSSFLTDHRCLYANS
jgi:hypothetical protein